MPARTVPSVTSATNYHDHLSSAQQVWGCSATDFAQAWREKAVEAEEQGDSSLAAAAAAMASSEPDATLDETLTATLDTVTARAIELGEARTASEKRWQTGRHLAWRTICNLLSGKSVQIERDNPQEPGRSSELRNFYTLARYLGVDRCREQKARTAFRAWHTTRPAAPAVAKEMARRGW